MSELTSTLKRFLKQANEAWKEEATRAKEERGSVDDGRYVARITGAEFGESKSTDRPMVVFSMTILEGDSKGEIIRKFRMLDGDDGLFWFGKEMQNLGYDPEEITFDTKKSKDDGFILNVLEALVEEKPVVKVRLKTKGDFQNVDIEQVVEDYESEDEEDEKPKKKSKDAKASKKKVVDEDEDDEDDEDEEEEAPKKSSKAKQSKPSKPVKSKSKKDEDEDEDEEEEEKPKKSKSKKDDEDEDDEEVVAKVGMKVSFKWKGEDLEGVIREIDEDEEKAKVKSGSKVYPVSIDKLELIESETDEDDEDDD